MEVNAVVFGLVQVDLVQIYLLYLLVNVPVCFGALYDEEKTSNLHQVSAHNDHKYYDIVGFKQFPIVFTVVFSRHHQKYEGCCEDQEETQVEDIGFALAKFALRHPANNQTS